MTEFLHALTLDAGYNAALVVVGAALLGFSAGMAGTFLFLRKRALVCDALAHATLPGVCLAFVIMVMLGGDGRNLAGLLFGSAVTASIGLLIITWMTQKTRLTEDAAIGAVLSVFFGMGVVLLTIIQSMSSGSQAGLEKFLLGATAGMLFQDAMIIAAGGGLAVAMTLLIRRPMTLVAFDAGYASTRGYDIRQIDLAMMALVLAVTVIGLKIVGLIMIVALLIIPAVTARFWTERSDHVLWIASIIGTLSGYIGAALSASVPALPTGPIIVLICAAIFVLSLLFAPARGVVTAVYHHWQFQRRVHLRQGLLALVRSEAIHDTFTLATLRAAGYIRKDGVATAAGRTQAAQAAHDERRWEVARRLHSDEALTSRYDGLTSIDAVFTSDEITEFDSILGVSSTILDYNKRGDPA